MAIKAEDIFSPETIEKMLDVIETPSDNFVEVAKIAGLDPAKDFIGGDMSGCDFSDCDLRGFDFTPCDLTGATGKNVIVDKTTIFVDAKLDGSIFQTRH